MKTSSIKSSVGNIQDIRLCSNEKHNLKTGITNFVNPQIEGVHNTVSFGAGSNLTKHCLFHFRKLSDYMKNPSEMTNALIAMIGTGMIAPFAIMCSPKKKCKHSQDKKIDREKKFFQALRQPVSAFLAFAFQVPTTVGIARCFDYMAFKKHLKLFKDDVLGDFVPIKDYLIREAKKALRENANPELKQEWAKELKYAENTEKLKSAFRNQIINDYKEVGLEISDAKLEKLVNDQKRFRNFVAEKIALQKYNNLLDKKVAELADKKFEIKDIDLVTPKYQGLAKQRYSEEFAQLRKNAKLSLFDRFIGAIGLSNKKLNALNKAEKKLAKEKGLEIIKKEMPEILTNDMTRLRKFIKDKNALAQKLYANKIFWLSLVSNLFMVAISCVALNWLHPKFAKFVDNIRGKKNSPQPQQEKKVEVSKR